MCRFSTSLILAVAALFQFAICQTLAQKKPNVLFIIADDLARQIAHLNVSPMAVPTPNIDALAAKGVSFFNAHVCAPACNPSRTCFLYGMSPLDTNVMANADAADNPAILNKEHMVGYFQRNGYRTVGGMRMFHSNSKVDKKFNLNFYIGGKGGYANRSGDNRLADPRLTSGVDFGTINEPISNDPNWLSVSRILLEMKANEGKTQPGFFASGFKTCHNPLYNSIDIMTNIVSNPSRPLDPTNDFADLGQKGKTIASFGRPNAQLCLANEALGTSYIRHYYGCIAMVDTLVGRLMDFVNNSPEEWFVVFTSDHGFHLLDKVLMTKFTLWPQVTQVPLVIYGPGFTGGKKIHTPVSLVDLFPTFQKMLGVPSPTNVQFKGVDLQSIAAGTDRRPVVTYNSEGKAVNTKEWHLIRYTKFNYTTRTYGPPGTEFELYDRINDPWALTNLASQFPDVVNQLKDVEM